MPEQNNYNRLYDFPQEEDNQIRLPVEPLPQPSEPLQEQPSRRLRLTVYPKNDLTAGPPTGAVEQQPEEATYKFTPVDFNPFEKESMTHKEDKRKKLSEIWKESNLLGKLGIAVAGAPYGLGHSLIVNPIESAASLVHQAQQGEFVSNPQNIEENVGKAAAAAGLAGTGGLAGVGEGGVALGSGPIRKFAEVRKAIEGDPNYVYHATNAERANEIAESGKLGLYKPGEFTDQEVWPDGSTSKRNYFTPTAQNTWQFAPEEGKPVLLRIKKNEHPFQKENTGDLYSTKSVPSNKIEYLSEDGKWLSLKSDTTIPGAVIGSIAKKAPIFYSAVEHAVEKAPEKMLAEEWLGPREERKYFIKQADKDVQEMNDGTFRIINKNTNKLEDQIFNNKKEALKSISTVPASEVKYGGKLGNSLGVKPEELEWIGLPQFLKENKGKSISKDDIKQYIDANKVELKEANKGTTGSPLAESLRGLLTDKLIDNVKTVEDIANAKKYNSNFRETVKGYSDDEILKAAEEAQSFKGYDPTKYSQWQLPGRTNYREKLLTLPSKENDYVKVLKYLDQKYGENNWNFNKLPENEREMYRNAQSNSVNPDTYRSSHWDEPNILAHVRMNDRMINGDKSLHLEEIQSDWHQAGREKGYKVKDQKVIPETKDGIEGYRVGDEWFASKEHAENMVREIKEGVPNAPFKKTWYELVLKRMIREAAEKGYDKLSWTPGEAQAERYDLSKQVDSIRAVKHKDGTYYLRAIPKDSNTDMVLGYNISKEKVSDFVGKELAEKIHNQEKENTLYKGLDLKVGGEGMKGFYDQIIPKAIEKIGKEYGVKVKTAEEKTRTFSVFQGEHKLSPEFKTAQEARDWAKEQPFSVGRTVRENNTETHPRIHYIDIPQGLKDAALHKGFPLFSSSYPGAAFTPVDHDPFIDRSHDVPYLAGADNDGHTVHIDRRVPKEIDVDGKKLDPAYPLSVHERTEHELMTKQKMSYEDAHKIATEKERQWLTSRGYDWKEYETHVDGMLKNIEHENVKNPPKGLYLKPYPHDKQKLLRKNER